MASSNGKIPKKVIARNSLIVITRPPMRLVRFSVLTASLQSGGALSLLGWFL
jgi:hypothetical protein